MSSNTGVIDITDDVEIDSETNTPNASSVANCVKGEFVDFATRLGK